MSHPPETNEPLLSHNEESMTEHRKSHPPETSLTSRELAEHIFQSQAPGPEIKWGHCWCCDAMLTRVTALIDAWVREREARILEEVALSFERLYWKLDGAVDAAKCVRAFATARKQQETP